MEEWFDEAGTDAYAVRAGVVFNSDDFHSYNLRPLASDSASTNNLRSALSECREGDTVCSADLYIDNGLIQLQAAIDAAVLSRSGITPPIYHAQMMPMSGFLGDSSYIRSFAPIFYVLTYSFFIQVCLHSLCCHYSQYVSF